MNGITVPPPIIHPAKPHNDKLSRIIRADIEQLKKYIRAVYEPDDIVELRLIGKGKRPKKRWVQANNLSDLYLELTEYNRAGYNIYAGSNPRKDFNLSGDKSVKLARCLFCDFDKIEPGDGCGLLEFISDRIYQAGIDEPDLIIYSGHGLHTYWKLNQPVSDLKLWSQIQSNLNELLDADKAIKNPERIMRLPGFINVKSEPTDCFIVQ